MVKQNWTGGTREEVDTTGIAQEEATGLGSWLIVSGGEEGGAQDGFVCDEADSHCACGQVLDWHNSSLGFGETRIFR